MNSTDSGPSVRTTDGADDRSLLSILAALSDKALLQLADRIGLSIEKRKRVSASVQVARYLAGAVQTEQLTRLPSDTLHLLRRILDAGGRLRLTQLPLEVRPLVEKGVIFVRETGQGEVELILPRAFMGVVPVTEGEDPRGMRCLLARAPADTLSAIAGHYLGRPATPPISLALEAAWRVFEDPDGVDEQIAQLPLAEGKLLQAIQRAGGEVDTEELLELEREPLRLRGASVASLSRRGVGFSLERRGMLIPVVPDRHVIPTEFASVIGATDAKSRKERRAHIRSLVRSDSYEPRRATFAIDAGPTAVAMAMAYRQGGASAREGVGTPRSLVTKLAQRFGAPPKKVALLASLSRAVGLWDESVTSSELAPGCWTMQQVSLELFRTWRRGGAWDEARSEPEVLRLPRDSRDTSPIRVVRELVLDAVGELGEGHWVPFEALADYVRNDERTVGVTRLLAKWAKRAGAEPPTPGDVALRIVLETLPALGVVDLGEGDVFGTDAEEEVDELGDLPLLRVTPRGRALLNDEVPPARYPRSEFLDDGRLRIGGEDNVSDVLMVGLFSEIGEVSSQLELGISRTSLSGAVSDGLDPSWIKSSLKKLAPIPSKISDDLKRLGVVLGRVSYVQTGGFVWCDEPDVRDLLRTRHPAAESFLEPSPSGGLLLAPGVSVEMLAKRCRKLGVEVLADGHVVRTGSTIPPAQAGAAAASASKGKKKKKASKAPRKRTTKRPAR